MNRQGVKRFACNCMIHRSPTRPYAVRLLPCLDCAVTIGALRALEELAPRTRREVLWR